MSENIENNSKALFSVIELRQRLAMSQVKFAEKFNVSKYTVQDWEQGKRNPTDQTLFMMNKIVELEEQLSNRFSCCFSVEDAVEIAYEDYESGKEEIGAVRGDLVEYKKNGRLELELRKYPEDFKRFLENNLGKKNPEIVDYVTEVEENGMPVEEAYALSWNQYQDCEHDITAAVAKEQVFALANEIAMAKIKKEGFTERNNRIELPQKNGMHRSIEALKSDVERIYGFKKELISDVSFNSGWVFTVNNVQYIGWIVGEGTLPQINIRGYETPYTWKDKPYTEEYYKEHIEGKIVKLRYMHNPEESEWEWLDTEFPNEKAAKEYIKNQLESSRYDYGIKEERDWL